MVPGDLAPTLCLSALIALFLAACPAPSLGELPPLCDPGVQVCPPTGGSSESGDVGSTSPLETVTGAPTEPTGAPMETTEAASGDPGTSSSSSSSGEPPDAKPMLGKVEFKPQPLQEPGPIEVKVETTNTSSVQMRLEDGTMIPLAAEGGGIFTGAFEVTWGIPTGQRTAFFTPTGKVEGDEEPRPYVVEIAVGEEAWWDASPDLGKGEVRALRASAEHIWEFGSHQVGTVQECYLRRRDLFGKYGPPDVASVLPGKTCLAQDLALGPLGELYLLMRVTSGGTQRWLLATMSTFGQFSKLDEGAAGEVASALASAPEGGVVTCGQGPSGQGDLDARIWFNDGGFGWSKSFDYVPPPPLFPVPHKFTETIADCVFAPGGRLVVVGSAFGQHEEDPKMPKRERLALLEVDLDADTQQWTVVDTTLDTLTQSVGSSVAIDDEGRAIVGLTLSKDMKEPGVVGQVRLFGPGGEQDGMPPPLNLAGTIVPPLDVAWIPAGYFVLASAREIPNQPLASEFFVQAYRPGEGAPLWTYAQAEGLSLHLARTLTFVPGIIVAGGIGGAGFPTLAFLLG